MSCIELTVVGNLGLPHNRTNGNKNIITVLSSLHPINTLKETLVPLSLVNNSIVTFHFKNSKLGLCCKFISLVLLIIFHLSFNLLNSSSSLPSKHTMAYLIALCSHMLLNYNLSSYSFSIFKSPTMSCALKQFHPFPLLQEIAL